MSDFATSLAPDAAVAVQGWLTRLRTERRMSAKQVLFEPDQPISHVYFPQRGTVVSLVTPMQDGSIVEVAMAIFDCSRL